MVVEGWALVGKCYSFGTRGFLVRFPHENIEIGPWSGQVARISALATCSQHRAGGRWGCALYKGPRMTCCRLDLLQRFQLSSTETSVVCTAA